nr:ATP-binding cassette domain-containing protein [Leucobacter edaphi]
MRDVDLDLEVGEIGCLRAMSGAGKTTLLRIIAGLERPDTGTISGARPGDTAMLFQEDRLCEALTAVENVAFVHPDRRISRSAIRRDLAEILPDHGLDRPVRQLSGGMRRRVSLACAMHYPGHLLLLDEPFTGLDPGTKEVVARYLRERSRGRTVLAASHGEQDAELLGARTLRLSAGDGWEPRGPEEAEKT